MARLRITGRSDLSRCLCFTNHPGARSVLGAMGGRIQVAIRTRPTATFAEDCIKVHDDKASVTVKLPKNKAHGSDNQQDSWTYRYDAVLHNASQETVYKERVTPLVRSVLEGYNGTVMCYGQTGAGKTFTSIGSAQTVYAYRGIAPRAIAEVFQYVADHPQFDASIGVSYLEIYNDALVDLLGSLPSEEPQVPPRCASRSPLPGAASR